MGKSEEASEETLTWKFRTSRKFSKKPHSESSGRKVAESENAAEKFQSDDLRPIEAMNIEEFLHWDI